MKLVADYNPVPNAGNPVCYVSADHPVEKYRLVRKPVFSSSTPREAAIVVKHQVYEGVGCWYATGHPFGCGKHETTIRGAIRYLLEANGCTNIRFGDF